MDAKELRIGNWIMGKRPVKISGIRNINQVFIEGNRTLFFITGENPCLIPMPLTEEWLIKFGFEDRHGYWDDVYLEVARHKEGWYHSVNCNEYIDGEPFQYVHELQNLYFALCRKELIIKE